MARDFNSVRSQKNLVRPNALMMRSTEAIKDLELRNLLVHAGWSFTWIGGQNNQLKSRLDCFLISKD